MAGLSLAWKIIAALVGAAILVASTVAVDQGVSDRQARELVQRNVELQEKIEVARRERIRQINHVNRAQCAALQNLYGIIRKTIEDSDRQLETLAYYRAHPAEATQVHRQNMATLARFRTPPCPRDVAVPNKPITLATIDKQK